MTDFEIIVACSKEGGIGVDGNIPWKIPDDMKYFKKITTPPLNKKYGLIVGWKTYKSISFWNDNRIPFVISTRKSEIDNSYKSFDDALYACSLQNLDKVFVIGGSDIYNIAMRSVYCSKIYITNVVDKENNKILCDRFIDIDYIFKNFSLEYISDKKVHNNFEYSFAEYIKNIK